jgi:thiosulfate/3-mercaptopyruvate sulfurtransferase
MPHQTEALVSTDWLEKHHTAPDVRVVDASWYMPAMNRDPLAEFNEAHIPGAVFLPLHDICDETSELMHTLPGPEKFSSQVRRLGLGDGNRIVIYDGAGCFSAARVWWLFRLFGHEDVRVLDGGFPKWRREERPVSDNSIPPRERHFTARFNATMVRNKTHMLANLESRREQVLDARAASRFKGLEEEPRPGLRKGHIPGSLNLPYPALFDPQDGTFLRGEALRAAFEEAGVDLSKPVVTTCGSGITAAILLLGLHLLGHRANALYDGSWAEWGLAEDTPVEQ